LAVQSEFSAESNRPVPSKTSLLAIGPRQVPLVIIPHRRARRYVLRVKRDGSVRVTVPKGGSLAFAMEFVRKNSAWIEKQLEKRSAESERAKAWGEGTAILFRGEQVLLSTRIVNGIKVVRFADHTIPVAPEVNDLRPIIEAYLWALAEKELVARTLQLAGWHQLPVRRILVRNQRSRWGSCSSKQTVSLNWRIIQAPFDVRDYLILHELMHLREMNHSPRFWRLVREAFPECARAEAWLDAHSHLLR
jgi:predicted metal-dependent hydrolase